MKRRYTAGLLVLVMVLTLFPVSGADSNDPNPDLGTIEQISNPKYGLGKLDKTGSSITASPASLLRTYELGKDSWWFGMSIVSPPMTENDAKGSTFLRNGVGANEFKFYDDDANKKWDVARPVDGKTEYQQYIMHVYGNIDPLLISYYYLQGKHSTDYTWNFTWMVNGEKRKVDYIMHLDLSQVKLLTKDGKQVYPSNCAMDIGDGNVKTAETKRGEANAPITVELKPEKAAAKDTKITVKAIAPAYVDDKWINLKDPPEGEKVNEKGIAYQVWDSDKNDWSKTEIATQADFKKINDANSDYNGRYYIEFPVDTPITTPRKWRVDWDKDYQIVMDTDTVSSGTKLDAGIKSILDAGGFEQEYVLTPQFNVTFDLNDDGEGKGPKPDQQFVAYDGTVKKPTTDPKLNDYSFEAWCKDPEGKTKWDFGKDTVTEDTILYAKWTKDPVVSYNLNGAPGMPPQSESVKPKDKVEPPPEPKWEGYAFKEWCKDKNCKESYTFGVYVTENITLYAKWVKLHTVTFDLNGAENVKDAPPAQSIEDGKAAKEPLNPAPTREGYDLPKWYEDADCTKAWNFNTGVTKDITLYAKWVKVHKVTFDLKGADTKAPEPVNVNDGKTVGSVIDPKRDGYTFKGWYWDKDCTESSKVNLSTYKVNQDTILYALWSKNPPIYTVFFNTGGSQQVSGGAKVTEPSVPKKDGYTFEGWYTDKECTQKWDFDTPVTTETLTSNPMTLYAKWTKDSVKDVFYTVSFNLNGAQETETTKQQTVKAKSKVTVPTDVVYKGYDLEGWYRDPDFQTKWDFDVDEVMENITLHAKWVPKKTGEVTFTVTLDLNGGTSTEPVTRSVKSGEKITKPEEPKRDGYDFAGWYKEEVWETPWDFEKDTVTADTTLYAKWTAKSGENPGTTTFTVTFDLNGAGGETPAQQSLSSGAKASKPEAAPTREGYTFGGWYKEADGTTAWDFDNDTVTANVTLYAKWTPVSETKFTVTFNLNGAEGTAPAQQNLSSGEKVSKPTDPTREGYTFGGWYKEADSKTAWDFAKDTVTANTTLYAKWASVSAPGGTDTADETLPSAIRYVPWVLDLKEFGNFANGKDYKLTDKPSWMGIRGNILSGVPQSANTYTFTIGYTNKDGKAVKEKVKIEVLRASTSNLNDLSEENWEYRITDPADEIYGYNGGCYLTSRGSYDEFYALYLDGDELDEGTDYAAWRGSTEIEIYPRALRRAGYGSHTIALAFQDGSGELHCAAQNFTIRRTSSSDDDDSDDRTPRVTINNERGGRVRKYSDGEIVILPNSGYYIGTVTLNGKSVSVPSSGRLTGLRSSDRVVVNFEEEESGSSTMSPGTINIWTPPSVSTPSGGGAFLDVPSDAYYFNAVEWAVNRKITKGTGGGTFRPNATCSRADMLTFLWRANGSPEPAGSGKRFTDVPSGAYYAKAVQWASDKGLVKGEGKRKFNPNSQVTRAEAVTFLYRTAGSPQSSTQVKFEDVRTGSYYLKPVAWALNNGIANGVSSSYFRPDYPCTRADVMTFLYRRYQ